MRLLHRPIALVGVKHPLASLEMQSDIKAWENNEKVTREQSKRGICQNRVASFEVAGLRDWYR